ncbi:phosphoglycerate mutase-like protein [Macrolepiota fuliginosa MF-IS2]|uniref:Phosphoglycerate mutase-like protein n=1 Tax=Macrolepiota fuliginosa MF-IS2 TaxID=1400762 RepID=A0A9P6C1Q8_9AGAR|nr:phosphoglycerate mutase-like protein [Macrolepiota fuliginosa MF-IS2]
MITVTLIRHGESRDNPKGIWAGWRDAPLTDLGERQADVLGYAFASSTQFQYFYASDLSRAHSTALAVIKHHAKPKPPFTLSQNLREQHCGIAEGHRPAPRHLLEDKAMEEWWEEGVFLETQERDEKFPGGESLNDLARRAEAAIRECILPHVFDKNQDGIHIGLASHGTFLNEMICSLLRLDPDHDHSKSYLGLLNTAWSRLTISVKHGCEGPYELNSPPPLRICLLAFNNYEHLGSLPGVSTFETETPPEYFPVAGASLQITTTQPLWTDSASVPN